MLVRIVMRRPLITPPDLETWTPSMNPFKVLNKSASSDPNWWVDWRFPKLDSYHDHVRLLSTLESCGLSGEQIDLLLGYRNDRPFQRNLAAILPGTIHQTGRHKIDAQNALGLRNMTDPANVPWMISELVVSSWLAGTLREIVAELVA